MYTVGMLTQKPIPQTPELERRFWRKVARGEGCWLWTGAKRADNYGVMKYNNIMLFAHRVAWVIANKRQIPADAVIDHTCFNKSCVNPAHLDCVSQTINIERYHNTKDPLSQCKRGHQHPRGVNCKECNRIKQMEWKQRNHVRHLEISRKYEQKRSIVRKLELIEWHKRVALES
jgi:hypothetical protein